MADAFPLIVEPHILGNGPAYSNFTLDATTDKVEWIVQAEQAATITTIAFRYGARTGTPPTYRVVLQGVDGSGNSDGTDLGGGSPTAVSFTPPADATWDGTTRTVTLTNAIAVTRGQFFAIVIEYVSGTVDGSNNSSITTDITSGANTFPYVIQNNAGSRTRRANWPVIAWLSASKCFGLPLFGQTSSGLIHTGTTPDEVGMLFNLPAGWGATYKIAAVIGMFRFQTAGQTVRMTLYDTDGTTVLQQVDIDSDYTRTTGASSPLQRYAFDEATLSTLNFGSTYRFTVSVTAASGGIQLYYYDVPSSTYLTAFPFGSNAYWTQRTDAGAWTDTNTRLPLIGLVFEDITEPSGGGGIAVLTGGGLAR